MVSEMKGATGQSLLFQQAVAVCKLLRRSKWSIVQIPGCFPIDGIERQIAREETLRHIEQHQGRCT